MVEDSKTVQLIRSVPDIEGDFSVGIGPRFLELFSENLYSSPNKAFEELVANSWDAGATSVHIHIPDNLKSEDAAVWVLDNGTSMDFKGLELLWTITSGHKRLNGDLGRPQIGKFGIGKLATYLLASEITYICKSHDGVIRAVPLNYGHIEETEGVWQPEEIPLSVAILSDNDLENILSTIPSGSDLLALIKSEVPSPNLLDPYEDEFGSPEPDYELPLSGTWTLALMTSLKPMGESLQFGRIRRMLRAALPLSSQVSISLNGERLESLKVESEVQQSWILGKNLDLSDIFVDDQISVQVNQKSDSEFPFLEVEGIEGPIYGRFALYEDRISGGKSEALGSSNGFFINILGRVINLEYPDFGLENLNHSAWAKFRATIRADGLDTYLNVERGGLRDSMPVQIFKSLLMALFNRARTALAASEAAAWPSAGDVLEGSWKVIPLRPLADVVSSHVGAGLSLPGIVNTEGIDDLDDFIDEWERSVHENPGDLIRKVESADLGDPKTFATFNLRNRSVIVNESHPFYHEHADTIEEKRLLQDLALTNFLTEMFLINNGVDPVALDEGRRYHDELLSLLAQLDRRTGAQIASMLMSSTQYADGFETIVGDSLEYLGFIVNRMGGKGEPEGVAQAPLSPLQDYAGGSYSICYEAKSTNKNNGKVSNKEVGAGRLKRHRTTEEADYSLVVAPDFELGSLQIECMDSNVTPMRAEDLANLLMASAKFGNVDFERFEDLFKLHDPDEVSQWVGGFVNVVESKPYLSVGDLLKAFEEIGFNGPDIVDTSVLAYRIRQSTGHPSYPNELAVRKAVEGLGVFLPKIVRSSGKEVYISASPSAIRTALNEQLQMLPPDVRSKFDNAVQP